MSIVKVVTTIRAPIERVFDLSMSIDVHQSSMAHTNERAIAGVTTGIIKLNEEVTWEAKHFGITQQLSSRITACNRPHNFTDTMIKGAFKRFHHDHLFEQHGEITTVTDIFDFIAPLGPLGAIADALFLNRYMHRLLADRNDVIKRIAESEEWRVVLGVE